MASCKGIASKTVIGCAVFFLICGIIILALGTIAFNGVDSFERNAYLFNKANIGAASIVLVVCGAMTMGLAIFGFAAFMKREFTMMKMYIVLTGCTIVLQLGMGSFIHSVNINAELRTSFVDTSQGNRNVEQRTEYMRFIKCCGWHYSYDLIGDGPQCSWSPGGEGYSLGCPGFPSTDSCFPPCEKATKDFLAKEVSPAAAAAIAVSVFEIFALAASCYIIMIRKKDKDDFYDDPFHY